jgi:NADPH-dependent 2,4-dienoyl-CoA reductase/sulfur reductase-like enzyme
MARGTIADADCVNKARDGKQDEIIPCLKCFFCLSYDMEMEFGCSANPKVGREYILDQFIPATTTPKKVGIIGGGPAGMAGAIYAAQRGHDVTVYEKASELGGKIVFARHCSFKYALNDTLEYDKHMVEKLGVKVKLNCEATPEMIKAENYDVVFAAVGSDPVIIPIPGHDLPCVTTAEPCFGHLDQIGQRVVVVGGGEVGCETALYLAENGKQVSVIEMLPELAMASAYAPQLALLDRVPKACDVHTSSPVTQIVSDEKGTRVGYKDPEGNEQFIDCDTVVFSAGMRSRTALAESFRDCAPIFFKLGDCFQAKNVRVCNRTAFDAAMQI